MSGIALATRGVIIPCYQRDQIVSCDKPDVQAVLELRPVLRETKVIQGLAPIIKKVEEE